MILCFGLGGTYFLVFSPVSARDALPKDVASVAKEFRWETGFLPDFVYCLKVELSEEEFLRFTKKMNMQRGTDLEIVPHCGITAEVPNWWEPIPSLNDPEAMIFQASGTNGEAGRLAVLLNRVLSYVAWNS